MKLLSVLFLTLSALVATVAALSNVIEADDSTFEEIISRPNTYSFVEFYASWCGHCKNLAPSWEDLANLYSKNAQIQIVKIDADANSKVGRRYAIRGYPTLKLFEPGQTKKPKDYEGGRDLESFKEFLTYATGVKAPRGEASEDRVAYLDDQTYLDVLRGKHGFVAITASWCGYCKKLKPEWHKLANIFKNDKEFVVVGEVITSDVDAEKIMEKFEVKSFPTIVYVSPEDPEADSPEMYSGGRSLTDLVDFVNSKTNIGRREDGTLDAKAGRISVVDAKLIDVVEATKEKQDALFKGAVEELSAIKGVASTYSVDYYKKLFDKLSSGETGYYQKEYARLSGILEKNAGSISGKVHDNLVKRINILQGFLGFNKDEGSTRDEL